MLKIPFVPNSRQIFKDSFFENFNSKDYNIKSKNGLRIMTFNVYMWKNIYKDNFDEQLHFIKKINPDILLLQEAIWQNENDDKIQKLTSLGYISKILSSNDSIENNCYGLILLSKFHIKTNKIIDITLDNMNEHYSCIYANILEFHLFGTHLDVWDNTELSRINQLNLIINEINKIQNPNIILLGDLNLLYKNQINNSDWNYILEHDKLRNVETLSIAINKIIDNNFIDSFDLIGENPPKLSCCFDRRIDYIFLKKNIKFLAKNTFTVYSNCSDHLPIIIDLEYFPNSL